MLNPVSYRSREWTCPGCQMKNCEILPPRAEANNKLDAFESGSPELDKAESSATITPPPASAVPAERASAEQPESQGSHTSLEKEVTSSSTTSHSSATLERKAATDVPPQARAFAQNRLHQSDSLSRQQVEERHLQVVELLTRQLALNDPTSSVHHAPSATTAQSVAFAAPASNSGRGQASPAAERASAPPMWLDGAIGAVVIALASLLLRKVM